MFQHRSGLLQAVILTPIFMIAFTLVSAVPAVAGCDPSDTMAQWTVPSGSTNPPDINGDLSPLTRGNPTTQASDVSLAQAYPGNSSSSLSGIATSDGVGDNHSWWISGTTTSPGNYIEFTLETRNYSQVHMEFNVKRHDNTDGPARIDIEYYDESGTGYQLLTSINFTDTSWHSHNLDFSNKTNTQGNTRFRITPMGAADDSQKINFDLITFSGVTCYPPPTLSKAFSPDTIQKTAPPGPPSTSDVSLLTFTIRNIETTPNYPQDLTGVSFTDALPSGVLVYNPGPGSYAPTTTLGGTLTAADGGSTISLTGGTLAPGVTRYVRVYVFGTVAGTHTNTSSYITSTESGVNDTSTGYGTADLTVCEALTAPTAGSNSPVCEGATLNLTASPTIVGATYAWTGPNGFSSGLQNPSISSVTTAAAGTYSVTATMPGCSASPAGTTNVVISTAPSAPTADSNSPICEGATLNLIASSSSIWTEYGSNPVYDPPNASDKAYYPCVLYDASQFSSHGTSYYYKMWYADANGQYEAVTYSNDGISWSAPVQTAGILAGGYHAKIIYIPGGYSAPGGTYYYKIWYWDSNVHDVPYTIDGIRTADSTDGENWANDKVITQNAGAQLVTGVWPDWNRGTYGPVSVIYNASATNTGSNPFNYTFAMYFDGTTGGVESIGLGYSADGNTDWRIYGTTPVLDHGVTGDWDSDYATAGTVIHGADGIWRMWYSGSGPSGGGREGIGFAISTDGINWTKDPGNPIFSIYQSVAWRTVRCYTPSVLYSSSLFDSHGDAVSYKMWFTGEAASGNRTLGYALSSGGTYNWTGPNGFTSALQNPSIPNATTAASGVYRVTVTVDGCTSAAGTTTATVNATPATPTASNNGPICAGQILNLSTPAVTGATYAWMGPNGFTSAVQNPSIPNATTAASGIYSVTVTVAGCTSAAGTTTATVNANPATPTASNDGPICAGQTLNLSTPAVTGATYAWTGPNGFTSPLQNPSIPNATTAASGIYSVTVTVDGCTSAAGTTTATVNATPATPTASNNGPICAGQTLNLSTPAVTGATYAWTGPNGFTSALQNPSISSATTAASGTYSVTVTVDGCTSAAGTTDVIVYTSAPSAPSPTAAPAVICSGQSTTLSATVGIGETINWYDGCPGTLLHTGNNWSVSPAVTTTYYASLTNACGEGACSQVTVTVYAAVPSAPSPTAAPAAICSGESTTLSAAVGSGETLNWYDGCPGTLLHTGNNWSISPAVTTTYYASLTNACGASTCASVTVTVNANPSAPVSAAATPSTINYGQSSTLSATVGGGETVDWYTDSCGGTPVGSGSPLSVSPASTTTYYARARNSTTGCISGSCATVTVTVLIVNRFALDFDGTDDYVSVPDDTVANTLDLTTQGTLEAWIHPAAFTQGAGIVFKGTSEACYGFSFGTTSGTKQNICFALGHAGGDYYLTATDKTLSTGKWYHVACVWNAAASDKMVIYINGVASDIKRTAAISDARTNDEQLRFGMQAAGTPDIYYQGVIDEVRVWEIARDEADIRANMCKKLTGTEFGLAGYWKFDEESPIVCGDSSGNGNAGTITGAIRICSEAPIGDDSDCDYTSSYSVSLAHPDGDYLTAEEDGGTWAVDEDSCVHVYRVDSAPNYTSPPFMWKPFDTSLRYWGVFVAGGTGPTYKMTYHYEGYPDITNETYLEMGYRNHNCDQWKDLNATLSTSDKTLTKSGLSGTEFILGSDVDPRNAILYDGTDDYVGLGSSFGQPVNLTMELWFKTSSTSLGVLMGQRDATAIGGAPASWVPTILMTAAGAIRVEYWTGAIGAITSAGPYNNDKWYHLAFVGSATNQTLYINGVAVGSRAGNIAHGWWQNTDIGVGYADAARGGAGNWSYFNGTIDEVRIWDEARSQDEIRANMCRKIGSRDHHLMGYWRFDEETTSNLSYDFGTTPYETATMYNFGTAGDIITARVCSSAPIGDDSAYDYGTTATTSSATLTTPVDGDYFFATEYTAGGSWGNSFSGIQIYRVDGPPVYPPDINGPLPYDPYTTPNGLTPPAGWSSIDYYRYWGVFPTDPVNSPTYDVIYHYAGNPSVPAGADKSDPTAPQLGLAKRPAYCNKIWSDSTAYWAFGTDQLELIGPAKVQSLSPEYILGGINQPLAITLASFTATAVDGCIEIFWETATEIDTIAFRLWRSICKEGPYTLVPYSYTTSKSVMAPMGAKYSFTDCDALLDGKTSYYYKLEEIDNGDAKSNPMYGPIGPVSDVISASQGASAASFNKDKACFISILFEQD